MEFTAADAVVVSFEIEDDLTICNIRRLGSPFVISAGHSVYSGVEEYCAVTGMKEALRRALKTYPEEFFNRGTRSVVWDSFWAFVEDDRMDKALTDLVDTLTIHGFAKIDD